MSYDKYSTDAYVRWRWGDQWAYGKVAERYEQKVTKQIKGSRVSRDADSEEPAYLIEQSDGGRVLKSHSELQKAG